jgi:hypothetical protein
VGFVCGVLVCGLVGCTVALNSHLIVDVRSLSLVSDKLEQFAAGWEISLWFMCKNSSQMKFFIFLYQSVCLYISVHIICSCRNEVGNKKDSRYSRMGKITGWWDIMPCSFGIHIPQFRKCWYPSIRLHSDSSQRTVIILVTAENLKSCRMEKD